MSHPGGAGPAAPSEVAPRGSDHADTPSSTVRASVVQEEIAPALRLTYLDIKGKAETIRLALTIGKIPFEDRRVSYEEVVALRAAGHLPYGQVPTLEIDGTVFGQSLAILRWAGMRAGLYPSCLQIEIDSALQAMEDIQSALIPVFYQNALPRSPHTGQLYEATALSATTRESVVQTLNNDFLPGHFARLETQLARSSGPFFAGQELSMCPPTLQTIAHYTWTRTLSPLARPSWWQCGPRVLRAGGGASRRHVLL